MPPAKLDRSRKVKDLKTSEVTLPTAGTESKEGSAPSSSDVEFSNYSASDLLKAIMERNSDPIIGRMLRFSTSVEAEKRSRSLVISGLEEAPPQMRPSEKQLICWTVECRPVELYRLGTPSGRPRLVKLVLPSRSHWKTALGNAKCLKASTSFKNVFIRKSMTAEERKREYELRQQAREKNKGKDRHEWVIFRGELNISVTSQAKETWLTPHILDSELTGGFPYFLYRKDRTQRKGGGVCCIVRSFLNCTEVKLNTNIAPDILCCDIVTHGAASPLRIISVYRPPNTTPADDSTLLDHLLDLSS
ncbi:hypothetical protein COOONC_20418, partial [Cooperia oncophora]